MSGCLFPALAAETMAQIIRPMGIRAKVPPLFLLSGLPELPDMELRISVSAIRFFIL